MLELKPLSCSTSEIKSHLQFDIFTGPKALEFLSDDTFAQRWDCLHKQCNWSTVFQTKEFVTAWYRIFSPEYVPIVVKAERDGELLGLATLTKHKNGREITAAGLSRAEYHTWLATPDCAETFIQKALDKILEAFPNHAINFYNIPPGVPLCWISPSKKWRSRCLLKPLDRPLMDLTDPEVSKLFRKKQFREKTNRLKRLGHIEFERITDIKSFASQLDELIFQSDFRKGAKFNVTQFLENEREKEFLLALFKAGILHTTVLKLDGEIISSIAAPCNNGWAHLAGLNTYSPRIARHSPGMINFMMLGQLLIEEGMQVFDLTPGGDPYKERLATSRDQVHELYVAGIWQTRIKKSILNPIVRVLKEGIKSRGTTPRLLKFKAIKIKNRLALTHRLGWSQGIPWRYMLTGMPAKLILCKTKQSEQATLWRVDTNKLKALLSYNPAEGIHTRWDFLENAMQRFEAGEDIYTISENDRLLFCAWHNKQPIAEQQPGYTLPQNSLILSGIFCHDKYLDHLQDFFSAVTQTICNNNCPPSNTYCLVDQRDKKLMQTLEVISLS